MNPKTPRGIDERKLCRKFDWAVNTRKYFKVGTHVWRKTKEKEKKIPFQGSFLAISNSHKNENLFKLWYAENSS